MNCVDQTTGDDWTMLLGDSCEVIKGLPDESIDFGIHSPPFSNLYIYSDSEADMGNCAGNEEFIQHYSFLIRELLRVTVNGRCCAVHCKDLPKYSNRDGTAGLIDFPGMIIRAFEECGWSFHSRITIWKCPVTERERTNNNGLLHKTVLRDRSQLRQGMADYLIVFRKAPVGTLMSDKPVCDVTTANVNGEDIEIRRGFGDYIGGDPECDPRTTAVHPSPYSRNKHATLASIDIWRRYAEPVWWDISQTDVLNGKGASDDRDERHICPLQLGLIERAVSIWSNPGDVVLSPFAGIGSEGVGSLRQGRKFVGIELKASYFQEAVFNLTAQARKCREKTLPDLFSDIEEESDDES
jgi:DNA modification methylase